MVSTNITAQEMKKSFMENFIFCVISYAQGDRQIWAKGSFIPYTHGGSGGGWGGVRNVRFSGHFAYVLNEWSLIKW